MSNVQWAADVSAHRKGDALLILLPPSDFAADTGNMVPLQVNTLPVNGDSTSFH